MTPVEAARELGIRPQMVYGYIKHNRVHTFPNPNGKADHVDFDEVKALAKATKHHRPKDPKTGKPIKRTAGVSRGTIISHHARKSWIDAKDQRTHGVRIITDGIPSDESPGQYSSWQSTRGDGRTSILWETEELADRITKGECHIESPENLLAILMYHLVHTERPEVAASLDRWATDNGFEVPTLTEAASDSTEKEVVR